MESRDIVVTQGVSEAANFLMAAMMEKGDEVLLLSPCYPIYVNYAKFYGGVPRFYRLESCGNEWRINLDDIREKVSRKTRVIVLINPHNPTGALLGRGEIEEVLNMAGENGLCVVSDEIVYEGIFHSTAALAGDVPVIGLNGFSKTYPVTGWRIGYMYFRDPEGRLDETREGVVRLARNRLSASTPAQRALAKALLLRKDFIEDLKAKLRARRDLLLKLVEAIEELELPRPKAAFYAYLTLKTRGDWRDDVDFTRKLLEEEFIAVVPGSGFYDYRKDRFRMVFLPPEEVLREAIERLNAFLRRRC